VIGQQRGISHGIRGIDAFNNLAFADDLTIIAEIRRLGDPSGRAHRLLNVIEDFSNWSGMEVKVVKSCGMWVGVERNKRLPLKLTFREQQLKIHKSLPCFSLIPTSYFPTSHLDGGGPVKGLTLPPPTSQAPSLEEHLTQGEEKKKKR